MASCQMQPKAGSCLTGRDCFHRALYHCVGGMEYLIPCTEMKELEAACVNYVERRQARAATISERRKMPASWVQARPLIQCSCIDGIALYAGATASY